MVAIFSIAEKGRPAAEGFRRLELMASLAGATLYRAAGFEPLEEVMDDSGGVPVPLVRMAKRISD